MNVTRLHNENTGDLQLHILSWIEKNLEHRSWKLLNITGYFLFPTQFEYVIEVYGAEKKTNKNAKISKFVYLCIILLHFSAPSISQTELEIWTISSIFVKYSILQQTQSRPDHSSNTKVYFNEFVGNALRDNIGSKKISLWPLKKIWGRFFSCLILPDPEFLIFFKY